MHKCFTSLNICYLKVLLYRIGFNYLKISIVRGIAFIWFLAGTGNKFSINMTTGNISNNIALDRESPEFALGYEDLGIIVRTDLFARTLSNNIN